MSRYILLKSDEIIKVGDEYTMELRTFWMRQGGWEGKSVGSLTSLLGNGARMRRKRAKVIRKKVCVSWT